VTAPTRVPASFETNGLAGAAFGESTAVSETGTKPLRCGAGANGSALAGAGAGGGALAALGGAAVVAAGAVPAGAPACSDSRRRWKLPIWAREKRRAACACDSTIPTTVLSWEGSGRPLTVTSTSAGADVPTLPNAV